LSGIGVTRGGENDRPCPAARDDHDAGKKIKDKKPHTLVDTLKTATAASCLWALFGMHPFVAKLVADGGVSASTVAPKGLANILPNLAIEIVRLLHHRALAFLRLASIRLPLRKLCHST